MSKDISGRLCFFNPASYLIRGWACVFLGAALLMAHIFSFSYTTIFFISIIILIWGGELFFRGAVYELSKKYIGLNAFLSLNILAAFAFGVLNNFTGEPVLAVSGPYLLLPFTLAFANLFKARELSKVNRSFKFMEMLDNFISKSAYLVKKDGDLEQVFAAEVKLGETILIKQGDRIPLDCEITKGATLVDEKLLTGNITLAARQKGDILFAGSVNKGSEVYAKVTATRKFTKMAKIVQAVKESEQKKINIVSPLEKYSKPYLCFFILAALAQACSAYILSSDYKYAFIWFLLVLALSGPIAYMLAVLAPLKFLKGSAAKAKININNINALEQIHNCTKIFIDKTGTFTTGKLEVCEISPEEGITEDELLTCAFKSQAGTNNIFAEAINKYADGKIKDSKITSLQAHPSYGTIVKAAKDTIIAGRKTWLEQQGVDLPKETEKPDKTVFYIAKNGKFMGRIFFTDKLRAHAKSVVEYLKKEGKSICLISGDNTGAVAFVAQKCGIEEYYGDMFPEGKASQISAQQNMGERVVMIGDGFNDILALLQSSACMAYTFTGNAFTGWTDIALSGKDFNSVKIIFELYKKQQRIVRQNLYLSVLFSLIIMYFVFKGNCFAHWYGLIGLICAGVLIIILNSTRMLK